MNIEDRLRTRLADRYDIQGTLGEGGMATVFLARDLKHHRRVALKVLHPELAAVLGPDRFLAEIRTTANLQHPHIVPLHDSGDADGLLYYVMPVLEGETLRERLRREQQLPIDEAIRIARSIAATLEYAHRHGVIHRDIKPDNIYLHEGQALIADFGIALAVTSAGGERMTKTGLSLGTPEYMSPEQALGERSITAKTDVYALACVLYEMLTGEPPFRGATIQAILGRILQDSPAPPSRVRPSVPAAIDDAVLAALARLPADRTQSAAAFGEALVGTGPARTTASSSVETRGSTRTAAWPWQIASAVLAIVAVAGWIRAVVPGRVPYTGPSGCEATEGVWRHAMADVSGVWIMHNGYGLEVKFSNGASVPEYSFWRNVRCTDSTATSVILGSTLKEPGSTWQQGNEVTGPVHISEGIQTWQNPDSTGKLGAVMRGERIR